MSDKFHAEISIPTDDEGYVLLKCPYCGIYSMVTPVDFEDDWVVELFCPSCGLDGENYLTDDVIELAMVIAKNKAGDLLYDELKKMEHKFKKGTITFQAGSPLKHEPENPIRSGIEAMEIVHFPCCLRSAKIKPILKMTGCYCPFCGVKNYELE